jgi:hypothetical protein
MIAVAPIAIKMTRLFFDIVNPLNKLFSDHQICSSYSKGLLKVRDHARVWFVLTLSVGVILLSRILSIVLDTFLSYNCLNRHIVF